MFMIKTEKLPLFLLLHLNTMSQGCFLPLFKIVPGWSVLDLSFKLLG